MKAKKSKLKVLVWDIETSHDIVATFDMYKTTITPDRHLKHWFIICSGWQWEGSKTIHNVSLLDNQKLFKKDFTNDLHVVQTMHKVLSEADAIIGHNVAKFDLKKFNARAIYHKLGPIKPLVIVDTLKMARKYFKFTFNRLGAIGEYLGIGGKIKVDASVWLQCLNGDPKAIKQLVKYNKQDIRLTRQVYKALAPYCTTALNYSVFDPEAADLHCPRCSSTRLNLDGWRYTETRRYRGYKCGECGARPRAIKADPAYKASIK